MVKFYRKFFANPAAYYICLRLKSSRVILCNLAGTKKHYNYVLADLAVNHSVKLYLFDT